MKRTKEYCLEKAKAFWVKELGEKLTVLAHEAGEVELYEDEGELHI